MAKWIKSVMRELSNVFSAVCVPGKSQAKASAVQMCKSKFGSVHKNQLQHSQEPSSLYSVRKFKDHRKKKVSLKGIWNDRMSTLLFRPGFSNFGSFKVFQSLPLKSLPSRIARSAFAQNIRFSYKEPWMMSDEEVVERITKHECVGKLQHGIVSKYESNQLASNQPVEDRRFVARPLHDRDALLFGVLDGHGGDSCAHSVSQRLPDYISTALLPNEILLGPTVRNYLFSKHLLVANTVDQYNYREDPACYGNLKEYFAELCRVQKRHHSGNTRMPTLTHLQESHSFHAAAMEAREEQVFHTMTALSKAFLRLDGDLSQEALSQGEEKDGDEHNIKAAISGACALVAYLKGSELTVANCGDCRAVLGVQSEDGLWSAMQLSHDHTAGNPSEVQRVLSEHPTEESSTCLKYERLLGRLTPLRAFGDAKFKWDKKKQDKLFQHRGVTPLSDAKEFHTPPYLTSEPEVTSYQLQRSDKFLILATDGLWDMLSNEEAVHFVKENLHRCKQEPVSQQGGAYSITYQEQSVGCELENSASCLIKEALGGDDHVSVSTSLNIPYPDVRMYRDDITVTVVHFDWSKALVE